MKLFVKKCLPFRLCLVLQFAERMFPTAVGVNARGH